MSINTYTIIGKGDKTNVATNSSMDGEEDKSETQVIAYGNWCEMIREINSRESVHSTPGLLMRSMDEKNGSVRTSFMYLTQSGEIKISDFSHKFKKYYLSGCNGLMLESRFGLRSCPSLSSVNSSEVNCLMITNPATNQQLRLPPFTYIDPTQPFVTSFAIAYVATRMEYKVCHTYSTPNALPCFEPQKVRKHCAILTVGVDNSWRTVDTQHLSLDSCHQLKMAPLATEGFVHWVMQDLYSTSNGFVLTLNMETETMTRYIAPRCVGGFHYYKYFSTGESNLSLFIGRDYFQWNVLEMNSETGRWTKLFYMDLGAHKALFDESYDREDEGARLGCRLFPAGWLKYREVIVFVVEMLRRDNSTSLTTSRVVYNVQTRDVTVLRSDHKTLRNYLFHRDNQLIIHGMQD